MCRALFFLLAVWLISGCAGQSLRAPKDGGKLVTQVKSAHFVVYSDAGAERANELAQQLEQAYYVLEHVGFPYDPPLKRVTEVIEFSAWRNLEEIDQPATGLYKDAWEPLSGAGLSIVAGGKSDSPLGVAIHELVHSFVAHHLPNAPTWLNEGLAEYYSTMEFENSEVVLGYHLLRHLNEGQVDTTYYLDVLPGEELRLEKMRSMTQPEFYADKRLSYPSAWSAVYALNSSSYRRDFDRYLDSLQSGKVNRSLAFEKYLVPLEGVELDRSQSKALFGEELEHRTIPLLQQVRTDLSAPQVLGDAQTMSLYARVASGEQALGLAQAAVTRQGAGAEEWATLGILELRSSDVRPDQVFAHLERAYSLALPDEKTRYAALILEYIRSTDKADIDKLDALALQVIRGARSPQAHESVAKYLLWRGRTRVAEREIKRSLKLDPARPSAWSVLGAIKANQKNYEDAVKFQILAVNLWAHRAPPGSVEELNTYRKKAGKVSASN